MAGARGSAKNYLFSAGLRRGRLFEDIQESSRAIDSVALGPIRFTILARSSRSMARCAVLQGVTGNETLDGTLGACTGPPAYWNALP